MSEDRKFYLVEEGIVSEEEKFYVSIVDGEKFGLLAGPYDTHEEALSMVEPAKEIAIEHDPWAWYAAFGTCKMPVGYTKPGVLNDLLEKEVAD